MKYLARLVGVGAFLAMLMDFFLPWFRVEGTRMASILLDGDILSPIGILSKFANLGPSDFMTFLFFLVPFLFIYLGAVYCMFNLYKGGVICMVALSFLITLLAVNYYAVSSDPSAILGQMVGSIEIGFLVILLVSIIAIMAGFLTKAGYRQVRREAFTVYTGED